MQVHTQETKNKISTGRKAYLLANPDKHPWRCSSKFRSVPCEKVKEYLKTKNINFVEEWQPIADRAFAVDIAFPDIKLAIDINGNQHYDRNGKLKEYYQKRHDLIVSAGWTLLELHYSIAYNLSKLDEVITIKSQPDYTNYFEEKKRRDEARKLKRALVKPRGEKIKNKADERWRPYIDKISKANINFHKHGWVAEAAQILAIRPQKVCKWMKRYMPNFYEAQCFKRRSITAVF